MEDEEANMEDVEAIMEDVGANMEDVGANLEEEADETQREKSGSAERGTTRRWRFSEGGEMKTKRIRKLIELQKLPIKKNIRFVDLVARYKDFPWAQDTITGS